MSFFRVENEVEAGMHFLRKGPTQNELLKVHPNLFGHGTCLKSNDEKKKLETMLCFFELRMSRDVLRICGIPHKKKVLGKK